LVGALDAQPTSQIQLIYCPIPSDLTNVKNVVCNADKPSSETISAPKMQTFKTTFGRIELLEEVDTPILVVVDAALDDKNVYTMNSVTFYTLGDDFTADDWAT
jgi:hypothetical protein